MLTIYDGRQPNRRELLKVGAALGGLSLPGLMAARANADIAATLTGRSVVLLNFQGGPTQFETFDPNMSAPVEIRSITGEIGTSIPGVTFGSGFPRLATLADRFAVVRSYRHGISSHGPAAMHVMAGGNETGAMMGALFARVAGLTNRTTGMPNNALITSHAMGDEYKTLYQNVDRVSQNGTLDAAYRPPDLSAGGEIIDNLRLHVDGTRLDDRKMLLARLDHLRRASDTPLDSASSYQQQAFDVLMRGVADAFDLSRESKATRQRYDTAAFEPTDAIKSRNEYAAQFSPVALGKQLLLARRLCEAGCGFVTVTCPGWDMHGGGKEFTMRDGLASLTPAVDKAVSAFLEDLAERGLDETILLVITGEFGRTPRINKNGGRDHWGNLCTLAFAGGGLKTGQVVGRSDRTGSEPDSDPISSGNVLATVMHTLFDLGQLRLQPGVPRDIDRIFSGNQPIAELVST